MSHVMRRILGPVAIAVLAWAAGRAPGTFELDRAALCDGELWRLWTGHLVHGSPDHFAYDVGAAALLAAALGVPRRLLWWTPLLSLVLLIALPGLEIYYGLSALLHAWAVAIAFESARGQLGPWRWFSQALGFGVLGKAAIETMTGASVLTANLDFGGPVVHASHLVGAALGAALIYAARETRSFPSRFER